MSNGVTVGAVGKCDICGGPANSFHRAPVLTGAEMAETHGPGDPLFTKGLIATFKGGELKRYCKKCKPKEPEKDAKAKD